MIFHKKIRIKIKKSFTVDERIKSQKLAKLVCCAGVWINRSLSLEPVINLSYKKRTSRSFLIPEQIVMRLLNAV